MEKISSGLLVFCCFALSACNDVSTPKGVIQTAWYAAQNNDLNGYLDTLAGNAKATYGSVAGMNELKKYNRTEQLGLEEPTVNSVGAPAVCDDESHSECTSVTTESEVLAAGKTLRVKVACEAKHWRRNRKYDSWTTCKITDINPA